MKSRSSIRKITKESIVLRYMRISKGLSMSKAGRLFHLTGSTISHIEHGRMDISPPRVQQMVGTYGFTMDEFKEYVSGSKKVPLNLRDECLAIVRKLDNAKLQVLYSVVVNFLPQGEGRIF